MKYVSTRGDATPHSFSDILLGGLAPDGGLYLPEQYPQVTPAKLTHWRQLGYAELAMEILSLYIDDIPRDDIKRICANVYTANTFGSGEITPVTRLGDNGLYLQHLSEGPTLAFKDVALQLLGALFEYELGRRGETLNILGATSGDTGSAAEYAMIGRHGIKVFMLSPQGRMSQFQQAQMFSLNDPNIHNLCVEGVFDDCQDIVKAVSNDFAFKKQYKIGSVNSINWARILAQVVYYFWGYFRTTTNNSQSVDFAVPTGNFGNICAGHVARMMGLPIERLILATNENNVLDEFFKTGTYRVRSGPETAETSSPSMDISKASNFERFIFDLVGRNFGHVKVMFETGLRERGQFALNPDTLKHARDQFGFTSGMSTHADRLKTIRTTYQQYGVVIDTHTADALSVGLQLYGEGTTSRLIVLETAKALKFMDTIREAFGAETPALAVPQALIGIEERPRHYHDVPADAERIKQYIRDNA
jgi:threonine synthase